MNEMQSTETIRQVTEMGLSYEQRLQEVVKMANGDELLKLARSYPHLVATHLARLVMEFVNAYTQQDTGVSVAVELAGYLMKHLKPQLDFLTRSENDTEEAEL